MEDEVENEETGFGVEEAPSNRVLSDEAAEERLEEEEEAKEESGLTDIEFAARVFKRRAKRNKDALVLVTGERGEGKTTLSWWLAHTVDPCFEFERNMLFNPTLEQLHSSVYNLPKYSAIVVDEAVRTSYRRNWQNVRNKVLNEMLALCRYKNKIMFFCIPERSMIDNDLSKQILFWVHVASTGIAIVFRKSRNPFSSDPWNLKKNDKLLEAYLKTERVYSVGSFLKAVSRSPNYLMRLEFDRMPAEIEEEYTALRPKFELRQAEPAKLKASEERRERALKASVAALLRSGYNQTQIIRETGCPQNFVHEVARENLLRPVDLKLGKAQKMPKFFGDADTGVEELD